MRIARPLLAVSTPVGILLGLREAWIVRPVLAVLMVVLMSVIGGCYYLTWRVVRAERKDASVASRIPADRED